MWELFYLNSLFLIYLLFAKRIQEKENVWISENF